MKIARIVDGYTWPSVLGPNVFMNVLSTELAKRGHECIIYSTMTGNETPVSGEINGYTVRNYKALFRLWTFPISMKLMSDLMRERPDIIHVHGYRSFHSELAAWLRISRKFLYVLSPHGSLLGYRYLAGTILSRALHVLYDAITFKFALRKADYVAATSHQEAKEALQMGVPQNKVKVMLHAEDLATIATRPISVPSTHRILAVGRVDPEQNWDTLIKAFAITLKQVPNAELTIVGPASFGHAHIGFKGDYERKLQDLCRELNVQYRVTFTGQLPWEELKKVYASSTIFVYIAPYGNYGRTQIEAATFGKPIISTPVGIVSELVGDNEGGFLVDPYDTSGIARAIVALLSNTTLYQVKQKAILERVKKFLDVKRMVDEYEKLYEEVIKL